MSADLEIGFGRPDETTSDESTEDETTSEETSEEQASEETEDETSEDELELVLEDDEDDGETEDEEDDEPLFEDEEDDEDEDDETSPEEKAEQKKARRSQERIKELAAKERETRDELKEANKIIRRQKELLAEFGELDVDRIAADQQFLDAFEELAETDKNVAAAIRTVVKHVKGDKVNDKAQTDEEKPEAKTPTDEKGAKALRKLARQEIRGTLGELNVKPSMVSMLTDAFMGSDDFDPEEVSDGWVKDQLRAHAKKHGLKSSDVLRTKEDKPDTKKRPDAKGRGKSAEKAKGSDETDDEGKEKGPRYKTMAEKERAQASQIDEWSKKHGFGDRLRGALS